MDNTLGSNSQHRPLSAAARLARSHIVSSSAALTQTRSKVDVAAPQVELAPAHALAPHAAGMAIDFASIFEQVQRCRWLLVACAAFGIVSALVFGMVVPPRYTSTAEILIDPANLQLVSDDLFSSNEQRDALVLNVESKMRLLTSTNVLGSVVDDLDLANDREFAGGSPMFSLPWASAAGSTGADAPEVLALRQLASGVKARRDERSFVVTLETSAGSPEKSVEISNAIISAFKSELVKADADNAGQAASELTGRLAELKDQVTMAEQAVERFRRSNDLQASGGELLSSDSMARVNSQVVEARESLIRAQNRYDELSGANGEALIAAAAATSATLTALRTQQATLQQQADGLIVTLGPRHPKYTALLPQLQTLEAQVGDEIARVLQSAQSDLQQAENLVARLTEEAQASQMEVSDKNEAQVQLRELERNAAAQAAIYEAFLSRATQITERQQLDTTNVRVISEPLPPKSRAWPPRTIQLVILGLVAGLALGALASIALLLFGQMRTNRRLAA